MEDMEKKEITQLIRDLESIKTAVRRNQPLLREISAAAGFRSLFLLGGFLVVAVSLLFRWLSVRYGSYAAVPPGVKAALLALAGSVTAAAGLAKWAVARRVIARIDRRLTVGTLFAEFFSGWIFPIFVPQVLIGAAVVVYLALSGRPFFIVGTAGLVLGTLMNLYGVGFRLREYNLMGYWLLATGALSFFLPALTASLWSAVCYGGACFTFVIASGRNGKRGRADGKARG